MTKRWRAWLACALVAACASWAGATPVAGVITALSGKPEIKVKGQKAFKRLKLNGMVYEGDTLRTGRSEKLAVAFIGGAEFRMNENSTFIVRSGGGGTTPTSVETTGIGQAWTRMLHGMAGIEVHTPMAVAAVRGTEADVDMQDTLAVKVYEGHVDVLNQLGKQSLVAGQMTTVGGAGQPPAAPRAMSQADYGSWQNGLKPQNVDQALQRLQQEAERTKTLKLRDKNGKEIDIPLEKKQ